MKDIAIGATSGCGVFLFLCPRIFVLFHKEKGIYFAKCHRFSKTILIFEDKTNKPIYRDTI